jgi:DNA invertase Pin-like site-specific DNA recombinase
MRRGRKPGTKKTGGRKKGSLDKPKQELIERIRQKFPDYCPVEAMCIIASDMGNEVSIRLSASKEVSQYIYPKLKSIDHNHGGQNGNPIITSLEVKFIG